MDEVAGRLALRAAEAEAEANVGEVATATVVDTAQSCLSPRRRPPPLQPPPELSHLLSTSVESSEDAEDGVKRSDDAENVSGAKNYERGNCSGVGMQGSTSAAHAMEAEMAPLVTCPVGSSDECGSGDRDGSCGYDCDNAAPRRDAGVDDGDTASPAESVALHAVALPHPPPLVKAAEAAHITPPSVVTSVPALAPTTTAPEVASISLQPHEATGEVTKLSWLPYPLFMQKLKHPAAQPVVNQLKDFVKDFPPNLSRLEAARSIHDFVSTTARELAATLAFTDEDDATAQATEGLEKWIVLKLYKLLFRHSPADVREDELVDNRIQRAVSWMASSAEAGAGSSVGSVDAAVAAGATAAPAVAEVMAVLTPESQQQLSVAAQELKKVDQYCAPREKIVVFLNAYRIVESAVDETILPSALLAVIVQATPPNFFSNLEFAIAFRHPSRRTVEERRCLRTFSTALARITNGTTSAKSADLPPWLADIGVTFRFVDRTSEDLLVGEVDELLDEYHRMLQALRELSASCLEDHT
eukprot:TRINITY_DN24085_c0_g1_i1.p1 TRINITY_DN24085_c0_g1~~TRINITY_DN24085_c0_g1_i1.p1  ORF type:complete len:529 (-),score=85.98 TRINITY_DN24085_c0_g1_i1:65-1651(-)